jgi:hypothetical protein
MFVSMGAWSPGKRFRIVLISGVTLAWGGLVIWGLVRDASDAMDFVVTSIAAYMILAGPLSGPNGYKGRRPENPSLRLCQ